MSILTTALIVEGEFIDPMNWNRRVIEYKSCSHLIPQNLFSLKSEGSALINLRLFWKVETKEACFPLLVISPE